MDPLLATILVVLSFVFGMTTCERMDRSYWRSHGYCPTCDRLSDDLEAIR